MVSIVRKLFANTSYLIISNFLSGLIMLIITAFIARSLGAEMFGNFSYVISFVFFFVILSNLGIDTILTRELSKPGQDWSKLINTTFILKTVFSTVSIAFVIILASLLDFTPEMRLSLIFRSFVLLFMAYTQSFAAIYQAKLQLIFPAIANTINKVFFLIFSLVVLFNNGSLPFLIGATSVSFFLEAAFLFFFLRDTIALDWVFDKRLAWRLLKESFPLAISTTFYMIYLRIDVLMLEWFKGAASVGYYTAAFQLAEGVNMIPGAFMTTVFPLLAKFRESDIHNYKLASGTSIKFLLLLIFPMILGVLLLSNKIIVLFFTEAYSTSAPAFSILIFSTAFIFLSIALSKIIVVEEKTNLIAVVAFFGAALNFGLNFYFIPVYGIIGASITTVLTEAMITIIWIYHIYFKDRIIMLPSLLFFGKILLATLVMGLVVYFIPGNVIWAILLGVIVYSLMILGLRVFDQVEVALINELFPYFRKSTEE